MSNQQSACDEFDVSAFDFGNEEEVGTWEASGQYQQDDNKQDDDSADEDDRDGDPVLTILAGTRLNGAAPHFSQTGRRCLWPF
jgi:hypothetical protein